MFDRRPSYSADLSGIDSFFDTFPLSMGAKSEVKSKRGADGLEIELPDTPPCKYAFSFRILPN
jgi:hypothetical protein